MKRALDLFLIFAALPLLGPLLLALWAAVRLSSPGPGLIRQVRLGRLGRPFVLCKLRTMRDGAEPGGRPVWAKADDPRVTPLGRYLRPAGLDELPQLWNVLRGEMSLVGPRPERPHFARRFARRFPGWRGRLAVLPGITGLAQVRGFRGNSSIARRLQADLAYARGASLAVDLEILLQTLVLPIRAASLTLRKVLC